jgi:WD repeat and SOF domain-containing protein 1
LRIPLGRNSRRELVLPVLKLLHPSTPLLPFNRLHKRRDSLYQTFSTSPFRIIFALVGTSLVLALPLLLVLIFLLRRRSTLVFSRAEIERIWRWEIASGDYPSRRDIGIELGKHSHAGAVVERVENPGLPMGMGTDVSKGGSRAVTVPVGAERYYLLPPGRQGGGGEKSYPPRPKSGSALDLDEVMNHCDFSERKYVRDCLEVLAVNAGLKEQGAAVTLGRTTFISDGGSSVANDAMRKDIEAYRNDISSLLNSSSSTFSSLLATRQQLSLSAPPTDSLVPRTAHPSHPTADPACDPDYPKLMHIFWAGPFTDKPYAAALSFLYTQNLSLDVPFNASRNPSLCRPQLWIWINPGSASSLPNDHANEEMHEELSGNPWSAPLLNSRFEEVVKFKLWNTTEQLDDVKEMEGWRDMKLFNSHGKKYDVSRGPVNLLCEESVLTRLLFLVPAERESRPQEAQG